MTLDITTISVLIGIIGGILGILNSLRNLREQQTEMIRSQAQRDQKIDDKLEQIDEKLESHNQYAERFADLSSTIIEMQTDIRWIKERN